MDLAPTRTREDWLDRRHRRPGYGATACDVDADGSPELLQSSYARTWNLMFSRTTGDWVESGQAAGIDADDNEDFRSDMQYACYCEGKACDPAPTLACNGHMPATYWVPGFSDQPGRLGGNTFTTVCADTDNDGDLDLFHGEIRHDWAGEAADSSQLLLNDGKGTFTRQENAAIGLARPRPTDADWDEGDMQAALVDLDLDGWKDLLLMDSDYPGTRLRFWHNEGDGTWREASDASGLNQPWPRGLTVADFDRDGDHRELERPGGLALVRAHPPLLRERPRRLLAAAGRPPRRHPGGPERLGDDPDARGVGWLRALGHAA
jgi:hypothetical protein